MQPICTYTIGVHNRKLSHAYSVIRLPREFRRLVGAAATIFETTYNGGLAFLVIPPNHQKKKDNHGSNSKQSPSHGGGRRFESGRAHWFLFCDLAAFSAASSLL